MSQVEVLLRGDRYFDSNVTTYIRTEHPDLVDVMGMINDRRKGKGEETLERPPLENDVRAKFLTIKELERVMLDNPRTGLYAMIIAKGTLYYLREDINPEELTQTKRLYMYHYQFKPTPRPILVDNNGHVKICVRK